MEKEPRKLKLPNAAHGGLMESFYVDDIISMEVPTDSTLVDDNTGEVFEIDVEKHMEKARAFDPFGHAGFDPSGKIRMTP